MLFTMRVDPVQRTWHVGEKSHGKTFIVNIIDKDVTHRLIVVDTQVYMLVSVGDYKVFCLHFLFICGVGIVAVP